MQAEVYSGFILTSIIEQHDMLWKINNFWKCIFQEWK